MPQTSQSACSSAADQLDFEDDRLDLKNSVNWRVFQILSIFRNLSFEECNKCAMASNLPLLKFLLICCNSKWQQLVNAAFDILSNISTEINLTMEGSIFSEHLLLKTVSMGLFSDDKFQILRAIEIFTGLCNNKCNETLICEFAEEKILSRIFTLVTAKDILLCIITLESLYQMSELSRTSCEVISSHSSSIDILVNLATTDAASFGSSGLAGIKVVEIHGHTGQLQPYHVTQRSNHSMTPVPLLPVRPNSPATSRNIYSSPPPPSSPSLMRHHFAPPPSPLAVVRPPLASILLAQLVTVNRTSALKTFIPSGGMTSPPPAVQEVIAGMNSHTLSATTPIAIISPSQGQETKLERMTKNYIHEHCSAEEKAVSNRGEMYAHYVEHMQSHDMLSGSLQMFITQLKSCFPSITITHSPGSSVHSVEGIRFTKIVSNGNSQKTHNLASQHPLMQQMLSSPTLNGHADNTTSEESIPPKQKWSTKTSQPKITTKMRVPWQILSKIYKNDLQNDEGGEQKDVKLIMDDEDEQEEEISKNPKMEVPNGLITPVTLRGRKRGSTNGTPKTWSKKPKVISRTSTSSSLSSVPETTVTQTPAARNTTTATEPPAASRCTATNATVIDASQPSTSAPPGDYMCEWDCCGR
uniref:Uncharacterized protein n=1 Tax=Ditylenchus dipsaci TaxID=166011 RepID=A0A915DM60_9BILA